MNSAKIIEQFPKLLETASERIFGMDGPNPASTQAGSVASSSKLEEI